MERAGNYISAKPKRIIIVEDNPDLRHVYSSILNGTRDFFVVGDFETCEEALSYLEEEEPDLVIIDITLPGMSGIDGIYKIKRILPNVKVMVVTVHDDHQSVLESFCAGAIGYLTKDANHDDLISAVNQVFNGGAPMTPRIASMVITSFHKNPNTPLTDRETDVLIHLSQGKSYDHIADALDIAKDTVKTHIRHIYEKLHVNNKSEAIMKARKERLV